MNPPYVHILSSAYANERTLLGAINQENPIRESGTLIGLSAQEYYYVPDDWLKDGLDFAGQTRRQLNGQ
jgi:hypothetical protein